MSVYKENGGYTDLAERCENEIKKDLRYVVEKYMRDEKMKPEEIHYIISGALSEVLLATKRKIKL